MECDICSRASYGSLEFYCASCARNALYASRLEYAQLLLEKASIGQQVENAISHDSSPQASSVPEDVLLERRVWQNELKHVQIGETKRSLEQVQNVESQTRTDCEDLRRQITELKTKITKKRKGLNIVRETVAANIQRSSSALTTQSSTTSASASRLHHKSVSNRAVLCREVASLMRLRQRRRQKDVSGKDQYSIAGLTLPDLRDISNVRCGDLTAVLGSVVHLLLLVSFYLGVRLPAEMHMPGPGHSLPTICAPNASYVGRKADTSTHGSSASTPSSPSASKHEIGASLKPRPLYIGGDDREERIFTFQKKEPHLFNLFVEGITLLAWNVAWLCQTQGFTTGTNSWEEICNIGKNLHQLLVAHGQVPSLSRIHSERTIQKRSSQPRKNSTVQDEARKDMTGKLGQYSDIATTVQGSRSLQLELMRAWEFSNWQAVALQLRKTLLTEIASADWELLKDQEWDDGGEQFDEAVFVKSRALDGQQYDDARSIMTTRTKLEDESPSRAPGTSGWTKLKSRDK